MKLSDMFASLAENARVFEERMGEWQADLTARNEEAMAQARKWQEAAVQRQDEANRQMRAYMDDANENVRAQWQQMQTAWEQQFEKMRAQGEEMRTQAMKLTGGKPEGQGFADWAEAYAAQMVAFAQKMQGEAANAIMTATEARGKAGAAGKKKT